MERFCHTDIAYKECIKLVSSPNNLLRNITFGWRGFRKSAEALRVEMSALGGAQIFYSKSGKIGKSSQ